MVRSVLDCEATQQPDLVGQLASLQGGINEGVVTCMSHVKEFATRIKIESSDQVHFLLIEKT